MNHHRAFVLLFSALVLAGTLLPSETPGKPLRGGDQVDPSNVKALANACLRHRESFPAVNCKFTYTQGTVASIERAIAGRPGDIQSLTTSQMRWVVDKQAVLLEQMTDPAIWEQARAKAIKEKTSITVPVVSQTILTNGSLKLYYFAALEAASMSSPGGSNRGKIRLTPLTMGQMHDDEAFSPGNMLTECIRGNMTCESLTAAKMEGRDVIVVELLHPKKVRMKYWLDTNRGFLPIQSSYIGSGGTELVRAYWTDIRRYSGDRWFPWRAVAIFEPTKTTGTFRAEEIRVATLDVESPPPRAAFRTLIPKGTTVDDPDSRFAISKPLAQDELVGLEELPKLYQLALDMVPARQSDQARWDKEDAAAANKWRFGIITCITASLLGVAGLFRWWYVSRRRAG